MSEPLRHARQRGRPPKSAEAMLARINIRVPKKMMAALVAERDRRSDGADLAQVIRECLDQSLRGKGLV